jgi:hypothetical protein
MLVKRRCRLCRSDSPHRPRRPFRPEEFGRFHRDLSGETTRQSERATDISQISFRVESIRAIKRVQYGYGPYVELGLWNDFADLFAEDAVTNYQSGVRGKTAIRQLFFSRGDGRLDDCSLRLSKPVAPSVPRRTVS